MRDEWPRTALPTYYFSGNFYISVYVIMVSHQHWLPSRSCHRVLYILALPGLIFDVFGSSATSRCSLETALTLWLTTSCFFLFLEGPGGPHPRQPLPQGVRQGEGTEETQLTSSSKPCDCCWQAGRRGPHPAQEFGANPLSQGVTVGS